MAYLDVCTRKFTVNPWSHILWCTVNVGTSVRLAVMSVGSHVEIKPRVSKPVPVDFGRTAKKQSKPYTVNCAPVTCTYSVNHARYTAANGRQ